MNGYQAQIDALRSAAKATRSAAEHVSGVDLPGAVSEAGAGMPGARSVRSFSTLGNAWRADIEGWVTQAEGYADALTTAAGNYSSNEDAAAHDFTAFRGAGARAE
ncbi:MAG: type VII secretion target [Pseudonocardiaceae bacterium]